MNQPTPPGWYTDGNHEQHRWWDGEQWTDHYQPPPKTNSPAVTAGILFAIIAPVIGLIISLFLVASGNRNGVRVLALSAGFLAVYLVAFNGVTLF